MKCKPWIRHFQPQKFQCFSSQFGLHGLLVFWFTGKQKGGFVKGWFWRMCPRSSLRSGGTCECTLVPVVVPGEHPPNHPLENHTLSTLFYIFLTRHFGTRLFWYPFGCLFGSAHALLIECKSRVLVNHSAFLLEFKVKEVSGKWQGNFCEVQGASISSDSLSVRHTHTRISAGISQGYGWWRMEWSISWVRNMFFRGWNS